MRLLLIHQAFVGPKESGGTRHYEFGHHFVNHGHRFTVVASQVDYLSGRRSPQSRGIVCEQTVDGVRVLRAYALATLHRSFVWRVISFLSFMLTSTWAGLRSGPVDVVMGTSPPIFQAVSAWLVAALRRKPFLLEVRDLWPDFAIDMRVLKNPALIWLSRWLENFLYRHADHLLVNSPAYRDYLVAKGIAARKVTLIPNGVDHEMFNPHENCEKVRKEFNLDGKFVVTYAGALGMANDIPTVLRAAEQLRGHANIKFLFVGDGKERPKLQQMTEDLGLTNVLFSGPRPKSEMPAFLAASNVCVAILRDIPMFKTTYPNKVFDYMAAGRPTILAIDGVIRDVIVSAGGGIFVPPGDDAALASAVLSLSQDPALAQRMGKNARAYVVAHFDRKQHARAFQALAEKINAECSAH